MEQIIYSLIGILVICVTAIFCFYIIAVNSKNKHIKIAMLLCAFLYVLSGITALYKILILLK